MKKNILLLSLVLMIGLTGCNGSQTSGIENPSEVDENDSQEMKETETQISADAVVDIVDRTKTEKEFAGYIIKEFFSDEKYDYYFYEYQGNYIDVYYADGTKENVLDAIDAGKVTLADLDKFDIDYSRGYNLTIIDLVEDAWLYGRDDVECVEETEIFYEDEEYTYSFDCIKSPHIEVEYKDGTTENVKDALLAGRVTLRDVSNFGIGFYIHEKNPVEGVAKKVANIVDEASYADAANEKIYEDENYNYYFSMMTSYGTYVYYTDGTRELIRDALESGRATVEDMDRYGISYYKENVVRIVDLTETGSVVAEQEREYFDEDGLYRYYFDCTKSMYLEVHYKNGTVETFKEAFEAGHVNRYDLSHCGISYYEEEKEDTKE